MQVKRYRAHGRTLSPTHQERYQESLSDKGTKIYTHMKCSLSPKEPSLCDQSSSFEHGASRKKISQSKRDILRNKGWATAVSDLIPPHCGGDVFLKTCGRLEGEAGCIYCLSRSVCHITSFAQKQRST